MSVNDGPNWTVVRGPAPVSYVVAVLSCPNVECQRALGVISNPVT